ncbi:reticulon-like protein B9 [Silene latifolia]|uniref:reticulon-like protein B9 n=1 Tax=Silene latifolia TaxID=37657 RepID=UPI003D7896AA
MSTSVENTSARLLGRQRPIHDILGGGLVANILLWRNPKVSGVILLGITFIWLLFEVIEYNFITFVCHIGITAMLASFIYRTLAELFKWKLPEIPAIVMDESTFQHVVVVLHGKCNQFLSKLLEISSGKDIRTFLLAIGTLLMLSLVGNYLSTLNLLFIGYICAQLLPFVYEKYEDDVDHFGGQLHREMKQWYKRIDETVLAKIPRVPSKDRKIR